MGRTLSDDEVDIVLTDDRDDQTVLTDTSDGSSTDRDICVSFSTWKPRRTEDAVAAGEPATLLCPA